ncbi:MAG: hypothetical protein AAGD04_08900 [Pseudomonadota bacterium]
MIATVSLRVPQGVLTLLACSTLAACSGGGGGSGDAGPPPPEPFSGFTTTNATNEDLVSTTPGTSEIGGFFTIITTPSASEVIKGTGALDRAANTLTASAGVISITDAPDPDLDGIYLDGQTQVAVTLPGQPLRTEFAALVALTDGTNLVRGIAGLPTNASDMPSSGTAIYTGGFAAEVFENDVLIENYAGGLVASADFAAAAPTVDLSMVVNASTGTTFNLESINITGMEIVDNAFTGGTIAYVANGAPSQPTGTENTLAASGAFFGLNTGSLLPSDIGGVFNDQGDGVVVDGAFLGD